MAQKLGRLPPFLAVLSQECTGQPAYFGPTEHLARCTKFSSDLLYKSHLQRTWISKPPLGPQGGRAPPPASAACCRRCPQAPGRRSAPAAAAPPPPLYSENGVRLAQWECGNHSYRRLKLARLLGQRGVFLTLPTSTAAEIVVTWASSPDFSRFTEEPLASAPAASKRVT